MSSCTILWCIQSPEMKDLSITLGKYDILRIATAAYKAVTVYRTGSLLHTNEHYRIMIMHPGKIN